jgi:hypothetical protein
LHSHLLMKPPYEDSFYHLGPEGVAGKACQGMACFVARHLDKDRWLEADAHSPRVYCLGKCYAAPADSSQDQKPNAIIDSRESIILKRIVNGAREHSIRMLKAEAIRPSDKPSKKSLKI